MSFLSFMVEKWDSKRVGKKFYLLVTSKVSTSPARSSLNTLTTNQVRIKRANYKFCPN